MDLNEIKDLVAWAYEKGAYEIFVDGHSFKFPEHLPPSSAIPPNLQRFAKTGAPPEAMEPEAQNRDAAIRSQDPDEYAQMADQWANYRPLTNRP